MELIDKNKVLDEIQRMVQSISKADVNGELASIHGGQQYILMKIFRFVDSLEMKEVDLTDRKPDWRPSKKQMESLRDMLKYNIGVFDYQKFMEVNSLYDDLTKILDYETN